MLNINTLIIDDEQPATNELKYQLSEYFPTQKIFTMNNPEKALNLIKEKSISLVFLDINMPFISGIDLAQKIIRDFPTIIIVFVTAYDEYAVKAFELNAIDYLLKPTDPKRLQVTINKIKNQIEKKKTQLLLPAKIDSTNLFIGGKITAFGTNPNDRYIFQLKDLTHFAAEGPLVFANNHQKDSKRVNYNLQDLEKNLPDNFLRTHKSFIVNLDYISRMYLWQKSNYQLELTNQITIPVSRRYSHFVKDKLNW
ncbi:MAG: LytR/AlgR family response regulator transcription factor [Patescibacteria group bacterium]